MRTTLDIEEDVLAAAKELAKHRHLPVGRVVSDLLRQVLTQTGAAGSGANAPNTVAGFRPFTDGKAIVGNDRVNRLRESEGI